MPKFQTEKNAHGWTLIIPTDLAWVVVVVHLSYSSACTKTGSGALYSIINNNVQQVETEKKLPVELHSKNFQILASLRTLMNFQRFKVIGERASLVHIELCRKRLDAA